MKVDEYIKENLSACSAEYARVRKEIYILVNLPDDKYPANRERVRKLQELEDELEHKLRFFAMSIAGYDFEVVDGVPQYVKK